MTSRQSISNSFRPGLGGATAFSRWLSVVVVIAEGWAERRRQRRALMMLSDAMLKDIGLGRGEAAREAMKPFWRK